MAKYLLDTNHASRLMGADRHFTFIDALQTENWLAG